jgi:hypothetical protein
MKNSTQGQISYQINRIKTSFAQIEGLPFNKILSSGILQKIADTAGNYRDKIYYPLITLRAFIFQTLSADHSCKDAVTRIYAEQVEKNQSACSINTGPYCKARQRLPEEMMTDVVRDVGMQLHQSAKSEWTWHAYKVMLADGTTLQMPDTPSNQQQYPQQKNQQVGIGFPIARMVALISLSCGSVIDYALAPYEGKLTGELSLLSPLLKNLGPSDLLLADRYYCTYALICLLQQKNIPVVFKNHAQKTSDFRLGKKLGAKDHLIEWMKPKRKPVWMSEDDYEKLPATLKLREIKVKGQIIITTLLDEKKFHKQSIFELYKQRWLIELDLRSIKCIMQMGTLRCKKPSMIAKEIACHFIAYNLIRLMLAQAAALHGWHPRQLSFKGALQLINAFRDTIFSSVTDQHLCLISLAMLKAMASTLIGLRTRDSQPRAIKRRPKPYPLLAVSRVQAKKDCFSIRKC